MNAKAQASARYDKVNTKGIYLKLNCKTDADIIEAHYDIDNVQGYIKKLVRDDITNKTLLSRLLK